MGLRFRSDRYVIEDDKPLVIGRLFLCDRDLYS